MNTIVITPTTGSHELLDAITSVHNQTKQVEHLLVVDGEKYRSSVDKIIEQFKLTDSYHDDPRLPTVCYLPFNTGEYGFYGHRIMASFGHLVPHDYILFLDQDNWYESNHVDSLVSEIETYKFDWVYSLRKIYDKGKTYLLDDNCESLGRWPTWVNENGYLIDSSCYCFTNAFLRRLGHLWDFGWGADRRFYTILKEQLKHLNYACTGHHTLCYRLGGNEGSVQSEFFREGNKKMYEKYSNDGTLPWHRVTV